MTPSVPTALAGIALDHVAFYVEDVETAAAWYVDNLGFALESRTLADDTVSVGVRCADIRFVLVQALADDHPGAAYVAVHGDGVADIALRVPDATAAYEAAIRRGASSVRPPAADGSTVTATIIGFGDVTHTFVERPDAGPTTHGHGPGAGLDAGLGAVDHFAVCVQPGHLDATVAFYRAVLGFELIFTEHIVIGDQAMTTTAVQCPSKTVTFTLIEPDPRATPGHIDEFLKSHDGPGVQHIALTAASIVEAVEIIGGRGVEFLPTPSTYYAEVAQRVEVARYPVEVLEAHNILVDGDHDGLLYQIFARSVHPRSTIFFELVERMGASSFGGGNITALYRAVEAQRDHG